MELNDNELGRVAALAQRQQQLEAELAALEQQVSDKKKELVNVSQFELPTLMAELHMSSFKLDNGASVEIKQKYFASIPLESRDEAFRWLRSNNYDGIIKNVVKCEFGRGDDEQAQQAMKELIQLGMRPTQDMSVHPMTLKSFVKDLFERGVEFPLEVFGAGTVNEATVVLPKEKKSKK